MILYNQLKIMLNKMSQSEILDSSKKEEEAIYIRPGDLIQGRFLVIEIVGEGSFGTVFKIQDQQQNNAVLALKVEYLQEESPILQREIKVLIQVQKKSGFPQIKYYGEEKGFKYCIMSLLGKNLESVLRRCGPSFSLPCVFKLAIQVQKQHLTYQILSRIEIFHNARFIHRDIKPDNFVLGTGNQISVIHIIDFGLSKYYMVIWDWIILLIKNSKGEHIPYGKKAGLIGTARYASANAHEEMEQSRRDDLESIGYILIYFATGQLPWMNLQIDDKEQKYAKILEMKKNTTPDILCEKLPNVLKTLLLFKKCFKNYITDVRKLAFKEKPNYPQLKLYFSEDFEKVAPGQQFLYDWEKLPEFQSIKKHSTVHLMQNYDEKNSVEVKSKPTNQIQGADNQISMLIGQNDPLKKNQNKEAVKQGKNQANLVPGLKVNIIQPADLGEQVVKDQGKSKLQQFQGRTATQQKGTYLEPSKKILFDEIDQYKYLPSLATTRKNNYEKSESVESDDGDGLPIWQDSEKIRKSNFMNGIKKPSVVLIGKESKHHICLQIHIYLIETDTLKSMATSFIHPCAKNMDADDNDFDC